MPLKTLVKKEFLSLFYNPLGFIFMVVFLLLANFLFFNNFFLFNHASLRDYFSSLNLLLVFLIPALTMRSFAEEKRTGTEEILFTLPLKDLQIVYAKFLANLGFIFLLLILTLTVPISVASLGNLDIGPVVGGYLGTLLLAALYISLGLYTSSISKQQISSFLIALLFGLVLFISGQGFVLEKAPSLLAPVLQFISPSFHLNNFVRGLIDIRDLLYFLSLTFFFLLILIKNLHLRRYQ